MAAQFKRDVIGAVFTFTIKDENDSNVNLATGDTATFYFKKPDGTVVSKTGVVTNASPVVKYTTVSGDLDISGRWQVDVALVIAAFGYTGRSSTVSFDVVDILE